MYRPHDGMKVATFHGVNVYGPVIKDRVGVAADNYRGCWEPYHHVVLIFAGLPPLLALADDMRVDNNGWTAPFETNLSLERLFERGMLGSSTGPYSPDKTRDVPILGAYAAIEVIADFGVFFIEDYMIARETGLLPPAPGGPTAAPPGGDPSNPNRFEVDW